MNDYLALLLGVVLAGFGGELFVRGAIAIAAWARVSPGIIGATVAAFSTSSPEFAVSVSAASAGEPEIGFGNALGANVMNVALILALALLIAPVRATRPVIRRDFSVALLVPVLTAALFIDGELSRLDGLLMLGLFAGWFGSTVMEARRQRRTAAMPKAAGIGGSGFVVAVVGLVLLFVAGHLVVAGAHGIALSFGIDEFVIGATVVAVGTTIPELATTITAKVRGHDDVALGTILGSNIFNGSFIAAFAAVISPVFADRSDVATALAFGFAAIVLVWPTRQGIIQRTRGLLLLLVYAVYLVAILLSMAHSG